MLEALRGLGYTTSTALADLVDNSIAAAADEVDVTFHWDGPHSSICIADNGTGMSEAELADAMRLGYLSPLDARRPTDLGRFGLGMKTASFSQARRLTVCSRTDGGKTSCFRWDLDMIVSADDDGWDLLQLSEEEAAPFAATLAPTGTVVHWQAMDRIVGKGTSQQDFLDVIDQIDNHLAMTYHRFLVGPRPALRLRINGRPVVPWDPFLTDHPATWSSPVDRLVTPSGVVEVQCHVLPHRDRLGPSEYERAGGVEGWTAHQGFYVYRNQRLILAGNWLGLGQGRAWTKDEAHGLARIRLDIPNTADGDWKIDVRKASASPPVVVRPRLMLLAEDSRRRARQVFAHRARLASSGTRPVASVWRAEHGTGGVRYRIDRTHPVVQGGLDGAKPGDSAVETMLRIIEETVPVQRIWLDVTERHEAPTSGFSGASDDEVRSVLRVVYRNMVTSRGLSPEAAQALLLHMEPFDGHPRLVREVVEER